MGRYTKWFAPDITPGWSQVNGQVLYDTPGSMYNLILKPALITGMAINAVTSVKRIDTETIELTLGVQSVYPPVSCVLINSEFQDINGEYQVKSSDGDKVYLLRDNQLFQNLDINEEVALTNTDIRIAPLGYKVGYEDFSTNTFIISTDIEKAYIKKFAIKFKEEVINSNRFFKVDSAGEWYSGQNIINNFDLSNPTTSIYERKSILYKRGNINSYYIIGNDCSFYFFVVNTAYSVGGFVGNLKKLHTGIPRDLTLIGFPTTEGYYGSMDNSMDNSYVAPGALFLSAESTGNYAFSSSGSNLKTNAMFYSKTEYGSGSSMAGHLFSTGETKTIYKVVPSSEIIIKNTPCILGRSYAYPGAADCYGFTYYTPEVKFKETTDDRFIIFLGTNVSHPRTLYSGSSAVTPFVLSIKKKWEVENDYISSIKG